MDKRIGAQLFTLRASCKTAEDLDASFAKLQKIGYKTIQVSGIGPIPATVVKETADKYGLEIVCTHRSIDDFRDVSARNYYKYNKDELDEKTILEHLNFCSRDNARRPVAWDDSEYNGFSDVAPWIPLNSNYKDINLKKDRSSKESVFEFYKSVLKLRKENDEIIYGNLKVLSQPEDKYWMFEREFDGKKIIVCCNFEKDSKITLPYDNAELLLSNYVDRKDASSDYSTYEVAIYRV